MRCLRLSSAFFLISACFYVTAYAADIKVKQNPVPTNGFAVVTLELELGSQCKWEISPEPTQIETVTTDKSSTLYFNGPPNTVYKVRADIINFDKKTWDQRRETVTIGKAPQPPPTPPQPNPDDPPTPDPKPVDVKSFRVILVQDPVATLTQAQFNTLNAKSVTDYLTANCTKEDGQAGWRKWSIRQNATNETTTFKALWAAVQPQIKPTDPPCVVIEVNGKAEIVSLSSSPEDQIAVFKKYNGGK